MACFWEGGWKPLAMSLFLPKARHRRDRSSTTLVSVTCKSTCPLKCYHLHASNLTHRGYGASGCEGPSRRGVQRIYDSSREIYYVQEEQRAIHPPKTRKFEERTYIHIMWMRYSETFVIGYVPVIGLESIKEYSREAYPKHLFRDEPIE